MVKLVGHKTNKAKKGELLLHQKNVDDGEIKIEHCPTVQMWMGVNTKPK
jgi:hypothetical protein